MNRWHVASTGVKSYLRKQNPVIEKFYAKPKIFGLKFYVGLRVKMVGWIRVEAHGVSQPDKGLRIN